MWGTGSRCPACRPGSHDLNFTDGDWSYLDSYFGGRDFIGEEVVYFKGKPVWAMNYYGRILRPDLITPSRPGRSSRPACRRCTLKAASWAGFEYLHEGFIYTDANEGELASFRGREFIARSGETAYELFYHGGLILE